MSALRRTDVDALRWCQDHSCEIQFGRFPGRARVRVTLPVSSHGKITAHATTFTIAVQRVEREFYAHNKTIRRVWAAAYPARTPSAGKGAA